MKLSPVGQRFLHNIRHITALGTNVLRAVCVMFMLCMVMPEVCAQRRKVMNRPYIDQRTFHYGFLAGVHLQDIEFVNNGYIDEAGNNWFADAPKYEPGFSVGVLAEYKINENIAVRAIPSMHFGSKDVKFTNMLNGDTEFQNLKSTYISLPIDVKFTGERFNNYRPYLVAGVNPMYDLTVKKGKDILLKPFNCYLEIGFGCDFYGPFFKFIPEIKFAYGLGNILNKNRSDLTNPEPLIFTKSLDRATSKMIMITFYFE